MSMVERCLPRVKAARITSSERSTLWSFKTRIHRVMPSSFLQKVGEILGLSLCDARIPPQSTELRLLQLAGISLRQFAEGSFQRRRAEFLEWVVI
ncbi:MAG: hypothetical protein ABIW85_10535 [Variovorax sp.]